jgi:hypothetical protein
MTINNELFLAILSMDSYNRGYGANISGLSESGKLGNADIVLRRDIFGDTADAVYQNWQASGFYALSYTVTDGTISGLANGSTVISYRGTDNLAPFQPNSDIWNGWVIGAGLPIAQAPLTLDFYKAVTGHSAFDAGQADVNAVFLTGHSLGGGLAGYAGILSGNQGHYGDSALNPH